MGVKDLFNNFFNYFDVEDVNAVEESEEAHAMPVNRTRMKVANKSESSFDEASSKMDGLEQKRSKSTIHFVQEKRNHDISIGGEGELKQTVIDIRFLKHYEDATEIVSLLVEEHISVLIDFQYMSDQQARRCLDYLDGARSVLSGSLTKVSQTMWLLAPASVIVNIEEFRHVNKGKDGNGSFDFDMKR